MVLGGKELFYDTVNKRLQHQQERIWKEAAVEVLSHLPAGFKPSTS
jgi:hypothetical protein